MNEPITCPFCGSEDYYITVTDNPFSYDTYSMAHCSKCYATGPFVAERYLEDEPKPSRDFMETVAREKWQTRPIEDDLRKRIAELEEAMRWRVVADGELPDNWESVLTIDISKSTRDAVTAFYNPETSRWSTHSAGDLWVTHWMPSPEPPIMYGKVCEE